MATWLGTPTSARARPDPARGAQRVAVRWSRVAVAATAAIGLATSVAGSASPGALTLGVAAAGLLIGLPHGSVDHVIAARLTGWSLPRTTGLYALVALAAWACLEIARPVALAAVLLLSLVHFVLAEIEVARSTWAWSLRPPIALALGVAGTGALLLPLARADAETVRVAGAITPGLADLLTDDAVRIALAAAGASCAAIATVAALRARRPAAVLDIVLLALLGLLAPPLVAFAVWFGCWHGLRHLARLLGVEPRSAALLAAGDRTAAVRALARLAWWPTLAAAAVGVAVAAGTARAADPTAALGEAIVLLLALTVPHMAVVLWIDVGTWRAERSMRAGLRPPRPPG